MTQTTNALDTNKNAGIQSIASSFALVAVPSLCGSALIASGVDPQTVLLTEMVTGVVTGVGGFVVGVVASVNSNPNYSDAAFSAGMAGVGTAVAATAVANGAGLTDLAIAGFAASVVAGFFTGDEKKVLGAGLGSLTGALTMAASINHFVPDTYKKLAEPEATEKKAEIVIRGDQAQKCKEIGYDAQNNTLTIPQGCNLALAR